MKIPLLTLIRDAQDEHRLPMSAFFERAGISRQGYHQALESHRARLGVVGAIEKLVNGYRLDKDRRAGSRSLHQNLGIKGMFGIGITKFEQLMAQSGLTLVPLRTRVVTTKSSLQSWNYPNLVNGAHMDNVNQVVVGDITYLAINGERYYLFCLTDIYSGHIVGHHVGRRMRKTEALLALGMWVSLRGKAALRGCAHHTDGGGQYFSDRYLARLADLGVVPSRAENCLQNGYAEQRNGLIKHHFVPTLKASSEEGIKREFKRIMAFYNTERKQENLGWLSPESFEAKIKTERVRPRIKLTNFDD